MPGRIQTLVLARGFREGVASATPKLRIMPKKKRTAPKSKRPAPKKKSPASSRKKIKPGPSPRPVRRKPKFVPMDSASSGHEPDTNSP